MNLMIVLIISVFSIGVVQSDATISLKLEEIIKERCDRNAPLLLSNSSTEDVEISQHFHNINLAIKQLRTTFASRNSRNRNEYCLKKQHLAQPIYDFIRNSLKICLVEDVENYLIDLLQQHLDEILEFFCENQLANFDKMYDYKSRDCFVKMIQHSERFDHCLLQFIDDFNQTVTKSDWCRNLDELENCTTNVWQMYCPGPEYHNLHLFIKDFFDEITEPCRSYYDHLSRNLNFLQKRCTTANQDKSTTTLQIIEEYIEDFIDKIDKTALLTTANIDEFCYLKQHKIIMDSFMNLMNTVEKCLPEDEQYFHQFTIDGFNGIFEYLCENNGTNLKKFIQPETTECFEILQKSTNFQNELQHCLNDTFYLFDDLTILDKLCGELNEVEDCLDDIFDNYCSGDKFQTLRDLNDDVFDRLTKPCSKCTRNSDSILMLIFIFILSKILT